MKNQKEQKLKINSNKYELKFSNPILKVQAQGICFESQKRHLAQS